MDQVPKILKPMVQHWAPDGYVVSFKLETDPDLLIPKAETALQRYGHQVVIGNELHLRKYEVVLIEPSKTDGTAPGQPPSGDGSGSGGNTTPGEFQATWLRMSPEDIEANEKLEREAAAAWRSASAGQPQPEAASPALPTAQTTKIIYSSRHDPNAPAGSDEYDAVVPGGGVVFRFPPSLLPWGGKYGVREIEEDIIAALVSKHNAWAAAG